MAAPNTGAQAQPETVEQVVQGLRERIEPVLTYIRDASERETSLYMILKAGVIAMAPVWFASVLSGFIQGRVRQIKHLTPSTQTLISHAIRLGLLFGAIIMALNVIGIDLTALAVFSGAIGFRSIRVTTNDNVDILVPNSGFINSRVTKWTLHEGFRRRRFSFGIAYGAVKDLVRKALLEAAEDLSHQLTGVGARSRETPWMGQCRLHLGAGDDLDQIRHRNSVPAARSAFPVWRNSCTD